jgi:hypothetical protein
MAEWWKYLLALIALLVFALALGWLFQGASHGPRAGEGVSPIATPTQNLPTDLPPIAPPTPFPPDYTPTGPNGEIPTATPYPGEIRPPSKWSTSTPLPISRTVDLAQGLPDEEKDVYIIRRSDGTYEKYLLPFSCKYEEIKQLMDLGPQDVIIRMYPLIPLPPSTPNVDFIPQATKVP